VHRLGAQGRQALADVIDVHGRQSGFIGPQRPGGGPYVMYQ